MTFEIYDGYLEEENNAKAVKEEIKSLLKENNFSIFQASTLFKEIMYELGNTPLNNIV